MGAVKQYFHDEICARQDSGNEPDEVEFRKAEWASASRAWGALIMALPPLSQRGPADQAKLDAARLEALAARDRYFAVEHLHV